MDVICLSVSALDWTLIACLSLSPPPFGFFFAHSVFVIKKKVTITLKDKSGPVVSSFHVSRSILSDLYVLSNFMVAGWKRYEIFGAEHDILLLWWQYLASGMG